MPKSSAQIFSRFIEVARLKSGKDALLFENQKAYRSETYFSIYQKSLAFGRLLRDTGVKPGDRVVVILGNRPQFAWVCFGVFSCGAIIVPLDIQYSSDMLETLRAHSGAGVIVSCEELMWEHA
ncbi:MAG TPA: AMP-binding protein, partial [Candidatus Bathyarchaeia archaeon]|nr:AMP-binding protein [Candidatus Bathyarchaeia archaeon]